MRILPFIAASALALLSSAAHATLLPDGSVLWGFEGVGNFAIGVPGSGSPHSVTGSLRFTNFVSTVYVDAVVDGTEILSGSMPFTTISNGTVLDTIQKTPDVFGGGTNGTFSGPSPYNYTPNPAWGTPAWGIDFRDTNGTWLTGPNGTLSLPSADAPDASVFETRFLFIDYFTCLDLNTQCPGGSGNVAPALLFNIQISSLSNPVPEPSVSALSMLALAGLAVALTRSARARFRAE